MVKLNKTDKIQQKAEEKSKEKTEAKQVKTEKKAKVEKETKVHMTLAGLEVLLHPLVTEKAVNMIEAENKITFIVSNNADKKSVKKGIEEAYGVKVEKINIIRDRKGRKKAIIKLKKEFKAQDLATKLKIL